MKPTLHDVARKTGFSIATVSRALHLSNSPNVSHETRRRVNAVAKEIGYHPNLAGRMLATGRSHTVSYWTYNAFTPYYAMVAELISYEAATRGYMVVINSSFDPSTELSSESNRRKASPAPNSGVDGLIACDVAFEGNEFAAQFHALGIPFVSIGLNYSESGDFVGLDLDGCVERAVVHLMEGGCRRIAMMCEAKAQNNHDPRSDIYIATLRAAGMEPLWITTRDNTRTAAREAAAESGLGPEAPDAILCLNDQIAVGCFRGLCDIGLRVPEDIMLVGCDGTEEAAFQACPITSIVPPIHEMCRYAWDFLERRISQPDAAPNQMVLKPHLEIRDSSASRTRPVQSAVQMQSGGSR